MLKTRAPIPAVVLYAHLVSMKNGQDQDRFESEISRQMAEMGIHGKYEIGKRRAFQVHGKQMVGYSLLVTELTAEESVLLQKKLAVLQK